MGCVLDAEAFWVHVQVFHSSSNIQATATGWVELLNGIGIG